MTIEQTLLTRLKSLPAEKKMEVLDFVEFLLSRTNQDNHSENLYGLWSDLDIDIDEEELARIRKEMWGKFADEEV